MEKVINVVKQDEQDVAFWLTKTVDERLAEVTTLRYNYFKWLNQSFSDKIEKVVLKRSL